MICPIVSACQYRHNNFALKRIRRKAIKVLSAFVTAAAAAKSLQSCPTLRPHRRQPTRLPRPWDSPGKNPGVGCHFLLQCTKVKSESAVAFVTMTPQNQESTHWSNEAGWQATRMLIRKDTKLYAVLKGSMSPKEGREWTATLLLHINLNERDDWHQGRVYWW